MGISTINRFKIRPIFDYLTYALIAEACMLAYLLAIPADPRNQIIFGYSMARLAFVGAFVILLILTALLVFWCSGEKAREVKLSSILFSNLATVLAVLGAIGSVVVLFLSFLTTERLVPVFPNRFFIERLQPIIMLGPLLFVGILPYQLILYNRRPWKNVLQWICLRLHSLNQLMDRLIEAAAKFFSPGWMAVLAVAAFLPLLFQISLRYSFPTGNAGLYSLMAELIQQNHFALPLEVPFYGPGGIPFAYPPVGFYLMAMVEAVFGISPFDYLRFAPPLFAVFALIPIMLAAYELTGSRAGAFLSAVIVATSEFIFHVHVTSGGIIRGLAFLFVMWSVQFFLSSERKSSWKYAAISGVFAGLAALTHLGYVLFIVLFYAACLLVKFFSKRTWTHLLLAAAAGILVVLPWFLIILGRYGLDVFAGAFQSHENSYFLLLFKDGERILPWFENTLRHIKQEPLLCGLIILGLIDVLLQRKFLLMIWFGFVLFFTSESDRYLVTVGALLAAVTVTRIYRSFKYSKMDEWYSGKVANQGVLFVLVISLIFYWNWWVVVPNLFQPFIGSDAVDLADFARTNLPNDAVYLAIAEDGEAEWFPYLMRRTPSVGTWGAEWLGTYGENLGFLFDMNGCVKADSSECVAKQIAQLAKKPGYLITPVENNNINLGLESGSSWLLLYENERYKLWKDFPE